MRTVFSELRKRPKAIQDKLKDVDGGLLTKFLNTKDKESTLDSFGAKKTDRIDEAIH